MTTPSDLFAQLAGIIQSSDLPVLVIGGHAVNAYGYIRTTIDADFMICMDDLAAWRGIFEALGYCWSGQTSTFSKFLPPETEPPSLPVDVMLVSRETLNKLVAKQRYLAFGTSILPVPQPLHLIALKFHAMRNVERLKTGKDLGDILQLIRICQIDPEGLEFQQVVERYANDEIRKLLAAHLQSR